jgi:hypothetical protein
MLQYRHNIASDRVNHEFERIRKEEIVSSQHLPGGAEA